MGSKEPAEKRRLFAAVSDYRMQILRDHGSRLRLCYIIGKRHSRDIPSAIDARHMIGTNDLGWGVKGLFWREETNLEGPTKHWFLVYPVYFYAAIVVSRWVFGRKCVAQHFVIIQYAMLFFMVISTVIHVKKDMVFCYPFFMKLILDPLNVGEYHQNPLLLLLTIILLIINVKVHNTRRLLFNENYLYPRSNVLIPVTIYLILLLTVGRFLERII